MKATRLDYAWLQAEGYTYHWNRRRGWYFQGKWIGYNHEDAMQHFNAGVLERRQAAALATRTVF